MTAQETALVCRLGEALQLLDDYQDVELDRHGGIATAAGQLALSTIGDGLRACGRGFATRYGMRPARAFQGVLFLQLVVALVRRHLPALSSLVRAEGEDVDAVADAHRARWKRRWSSPLIAI